MRTRFAYTLNELIDEGPLGKTKVYEEVKKGFLRIRKLGNRTFVMPEDREAWHKSLRNRLRDPEVLVATSSDSHHTNP